MPPRIDAKCLHSTRNGPCWRRPEHAGPHRSQEAMEAQNEVNKAYAKKWRADNPEEAASVSRENARKWRAANPEYGNDRLLSDEKQELYAAARGRKCSLCSKVLKTDNKSGVCWRCTSEGGVPCTNCSRPTELANTSGLCRRCRDAKPVKCTSCGAGIGLATAKALDGLCRRCSNRQRIAEYKLANGCVECGYKEFSEALDFDHLDGASKRADVTQLVSNGVKWEVIETEIAKCELVCAVHHRVRTMRRRDAEGRRFERG